MKKIANRKGSDLLHIEKEVPIKNYLSTGCTILDLAIADRLPGGFAAGRISHIVGYESSAKTVIALEAIGSAQRQNGIATFIDSEMTLDFERAKNLFDVDVNKLNYILPCEVENLTIGYFFDSILPRLEEEARKTDSPCICVVDSLSAMSTDMELDEATDKRSYGSRAISLSKGFRKHIWKIGKSNLSLLFVDQTRQNVDVVFGKKHTFSGGEAIKFYASTRVFVKKTEEIKSKYGKVIGIGVYFKVEKNKIAPPFREGVFRLLFDYGIDDIATNILFIKDNLGLKGSYSCCGKNFKSLDSAIAFVEDNNLEKELQKEVYELWKKIYTKVERKGRLRC